MRFLSFSILFAASTAASAASATEADAFSASLESCQTAQDIRIGRGGLFYTLCTVLDEAQFRFIVYRHDAEGRLDGSWGIGGRAEVQRPQQDCITFGCAPAWSALAHDGGYWLGTGDGRVARFSATGNVVPGLDLRAPLMPDARGAEFVQAVPDADGGLTGLVAGYGPVREVTAHRVDANGRALSAHRWQLSSGGSIVAWRVDGELLDLTLATDSRLTRARPGSGAPAAGDTSVLASRDGAAWTHPSLKVLGDGRIVFATGDRVSRWLPTGAPDDTFGNAQERGSRTNDRAAYSCASGFIQSRLGLRAGGEVAHIWDEYLMLRGRACLTRNASWLSADGSEDGFAMPTAVSFAGRPVVFDAAGRIVSVTSAPRGMLLTRVAGPPGHTPATRADTSVVEYFHAGIGHYFLTAHPHEIAALDREGDLHGWRRTGRAFGAWSINTPMPGTAPVCRYYGDALAGPNSHFYSAMPHECDGLRALEALTPPGRRAWRFERDAFRLAVPYAGECAPNLTPVRRFYNGGAARDDPNHRYTYRADDIAAMRSRGWIDEGVHFCAPPTAAN